MLLYGRREEEIDSREGEGEEEGHSMTTNDVVASTRVTLLLQQNIKSTKIFLFFFLFFSYFGFPTPSTRRINFQIIVVVEIIFLIC